MSITLALMLAPALAILLSAPAVFSVEPETISTAGGPALLLGFELSADLAVRANGAPASQVESVTANQLSVRLPPGAAGPATLTLEAGGRTVATVTAAFTYVDAPALAAHRLAAAASQVEIAAARTAAQRREQAVGALAARALRTPAWRAAQALVRADARARGDLWRRSAEARAAAERAAEEERRREAADLAARQPDCLKAGYDDWQATALAPDGRYFVSWSVQVVNGCDRPRTIRVILYLYDRNQKEIRRYTETLTAPARQTVAAKGTALEGGLIMRAVARRAAVLTPLD